MERFPTYRPGIAEVLADGPPSKLEADLLAKCRLGGIARVPGKHGLPPDTTDPHRRVRAGLIRYLMLGGCDGDGGARPHPKGVRIAGAWIDGVLDLQGCETPLDLLLQDCLLPDRPNLRDARIGALFLPGCAAPKGLDLQRLITRGDVHLRKGFEAGATVDLGGARIGGQLDCSGGRFLAAEGWALTCTAARIGADVFLRDGFEARSEVHFVRAEIGGQLDCSSGRFLAAEGRALDCEAARIGADVFLRNGFEAQRQVDFVRADVVGLVQIEGAVLEAGIDLEAARIGHGLFWKKVTGAREVVNLTEARVGSLRDDRDSWDGVGNLILDGFRYDRLEGTMSVADRIAWLGRAAAGQGTDPSVGPAFDPQPHVQLANILRTQGDRGGAARVMVDRERRQRRAQQDWTWRQTGSPAGMNRWLFSLILRPFEGVFGLIFGYGHRPARALLAAVVLIAGASALNGIAYQRGEFAPNDAVVLTSADWQAALRGAGEDGLPLLIWLQSPSAQDYETFHPLLYGVDLVLPFDTLGQEEAWRASAARGPWGFAAFYSRWFFQIAGIVIAAVGAAVLTGLVGRRD